MKPKFIFLIPVLAVFMLTACEKFPADETSNKPASELNDLKVSESFTWSTAQNIELEITGLPTVVPVTSTLSITTTDGAVLFNGLHTMSDNVTLSLYAPAQERELLLFYGSSSYKVSVLNSKALFSFIPEDQGN